jgi:tetratricopeptide (TPR) repeat protein
VLVLVTEQERSPVGPREPQVHPFARFSDPALEVLRGRLNELAANGQFVEAIPVSQQLLEKAERDTGVASPTTSAALDLLARLYVLTAAYSKAEPLLKRALSIREQALGIEHPDTATSTDDLGWLYKLSGDDTQAERLFARATSIRKGLGETRGTTLSTRAFLLSGSDEPEGYAAYSYMLLRTPPRDDAARQRYLRAVEAYLLVLRSSEELERHRRRSELNIVLVPVMRQLDFSADPSDRSRVAQVAQRVLAVYDYARAEVLLTDLGAGARQNGPYLVSTVGATAGQRRRALLFDMSRVVPTLIWDWVEAFRDLTAQERSWNDVALVNLGLRVRNILAVSAREIPTIVSSLNDSIVFLNPR